MHRSSLLSFTAIVLLAIAVSLIAAALFLPPAPAANASDGVSVASERVVHQFYAAANAAIARGDVSALEAVVAPGFIDRSPLPGVRPGREGLADYLRALHATAPEIELIAEPVIAAGDLVVARVTAAGAIRAPSTPWGPVDVFRVAEGRIVERRGHIDGLTLIRPLAETSFEPGDVGLRHMALERVRIAPGRAWDWVADGPLLTFLDADAPLLLVVETGLVRVETTEPPAWTPPNSVQAASRGAALNVGESLALVPGSHARLLNLGQAEAQLLLASLSVPRVPNGALADVPALPAGVTAQVLAEGLAVGMKRAPAAIDVRQVAMAAHGRVNLGSEEGAALVAVLAGQPEGVAWGEAWLRRDAASGPVSFSAATLAPGDGVLLSPGTRAVIENARDHPAVMLVMTLR